MTRTSRADNRGEKRREVWPRRAKSGDDVRRGMPKLLKLSFMEKQVVEKMMKICLGVSVSPPTSINCTTARWSVMQSYNLLKWHKHALVAAVKALQSGHSLSVVIRRIEEAMSSGS
ncbi:hypothetical protein MA16_Dca005084 [Dendrobium catenatum]|uniref:Uncharacterized protein n=1 Tax=Dendrobium catenatum TaxID=906689 RepID=A0A2I0WGV7_9ASPA|nr:hypothetical protein MA16_Dca005084 [Dendrobium catenatum]